MIDKCMPGDNETLNLRRALVNLEDLRISHQLLHWILGIESISTKDLCNMKEKKEKKKKKKKK